MSDLKASEDMSSLRIPVLPLRDGLLLPDQTVSFLVGRSISVTGVRQAAVSDGLLAVVRQTDISKSVPRQSDLERIGCVARVIRIAELKHKVLKVEVAGLHAARVSHLRSQRRALTCTAEILPISERPVNSVERDALWESVRRAVASLMEKDERYRKKPFSDVVSADASNRLVADLTTELQLPSDRLQPFLEETSLDKRIELLLVAFEVTAQRHELETAVQARVRSQMEKSQREYFLREKISAARRELGDDKDPESELDRLARDVRDSGMPQEAMDKALSEITRTRSMPAISAEVAVARNWIDWLLKMPWKASTSSTVSLKSAAESLDAEHAGLTDVKERILEHIATNRRSKRQGGAVLCLVGPPGTGKTSLGQSIAKACGREYVRAALGGVRDEAEIRGHRRTYVGAMPGKIAQRLARCGVDDPLFLLDELDKLSSDYRSDPASALLEVLDPEQNSAFNDHYLDVDLDLSKVLFVCTANSMRIPPALLDRLDVINLDGYTNDEKVRIGDLHLVPRSRERLGLKEAEFDLSKETLERLVWQYTREPGVRDLERIIMRLGRKCLLRESGYEGNKKALPKDLPLNADTLPKWLGAPRYSVAERKGGDVGVATGLAWTAASGDTLPVEVAVVEGSGRVVTTGSLGDVLKESVTTALGYIKLRSEELRVDPGVLRKRDIYVHFPEGAVPKDGPSAGITLVTALVSALTRRPVRHDVGMTGETTLHGKVLRIGGLRAKLTAAKRAGLREVVLPAENAGDIDDIEEDLLTGLVVTFASTVDEVLRHTLLDPIPSNDDVDLSLVAQQKVEESSGQTSTLAD